MIQKITLLLFTFCLVSLQAQTVNILGDPYAGNPYATIADALAASMNTSDVILISGAVTESVTINKGITLRGTDPNIDIIQAATSANTASTRVITVDEGNYVVNIENLGIRYGNAPSTDNGGGIFADKVTGELNLINLKIENNNTARNGGGLGLDGTNANIIGCTIKNNSSSLEGGGAIFSPNNGAGMDSTINIEQSLIDLNTGRNGGGMFINGNPAASMTQSINLNIENSTISNNNAFASGASSNGGGAILSRSVNSPGNVNLKLVHTTFYNNTHAAGNLKSGIQFIAPNGTGTNFSAYNSIIVAADVVDVKAVNFANSTTVAVVNCILGGLNVVPALVNDANNNNETGRTATFAGLTGTLTDEGGNTQVLAISESSTADDYCTATTGVSIPTIDQRGFTREGTNDAGAYEVSGVLGTNDLSANTFILYPNPAKINVTIKGLNGIAQVELFDITGKKVMNLSQPVNNQFNVESLRSGIYIVRLTDDSKGVSVKKLIIE